MLAHEEAQTCGPPPSVIPATVLDTSCLKRKKKNVEMNRNLSTIVKNLTSLIKDKACRLGQ